MSVYDTATSDRKRIQISMYGINQMLKDGSYLRENIMMDSGTKFNLFGNSNMITKYMKSGYSHESSDQCRVKNSR